MVRCWDCANIAKCKYASGRVSRCNLFNPYLSVEEFCLEMGISFWEFRNRTFNESVLKRLQNDALKKGIKIIKDWSLNKKVFKWVIYKVKM